MKLLAVIFILIGLQAQAVWVVGNNGVTCSPSSQTVIKGGSNPWPWGREMVFPWNDIDGVWQASTGGCSSLFTFKVINEAGGVRSIVISQYDPKQCKEISSGKGIQVGKIVHGALTGANGSFEFTIHSFRQDTLKAMNFRTVTESSLDSVVVMRMRKMGTGATQMADFKMERLKKTPVMLCE